MLQDDEQFRNGCLMVAISFIVATAFIIWKWEYVNFVCSTVHP
jgi:hypothetical protein